MGEILRLMIAVVAVIFASAFASVVLTALLWLGQKTYEALDSFTDNRTRKKREHDKALRDENENLRALVVAFDWCTENFAIACKCDECPLRQRDDLVPECELLMAELGLKEGFGLKEVGQ